MSAIFGVYFRDGRPVDPSCLERMSERLAHRGSDDSPLWCHGSLAIGQRILRTSPESRAWRRPIVGGGGELVLAADARLDNREELIAVLGLARQDRITDEDLILSAYRKWGRSAPARLIGDFAFAIWDGRRRTLFCARDPLGIKPFYYYLSDRIFAFASEIKGLFCLPEIPREPDEVQVAFFLDVFVEDDERTFYRGILRLPAANFLELGSNHERVQQYWAPEPEREIRYSTSEQYADAFRELFTQAVRCRLRRALPVGAALSGGLDSSSVVCTARRLFDDEQPLHTFSNVFPDLPEAERRWNDESHYIDAVTSVPGIVSHRIRGDRIGPLAELDNIMWQRDAPTFGYNLYLSRARYRAAHEKNVRVLLEGHGGDNVVSHGYERFLDLAREDSWQTLTSEIAALSRRRQISPSALLRLYAYPELVRLARTGRWGSWVRASGEIARGLDRSRRGLLLRYGIGAFVPSRIIDAWRTSQPGHETSWIRPELARRVRLAERKRALEADGSEPNLSGRAAYARSLPCPLLQNSLELLDCEAGSFSIELRYPFLDRRLVEFCLAVPTEQKLADGWTRLILRRAMEGILPPEVQWRVGKGDLSFNFVRGLREAHQADLEAALFDEPSVLDEYVDLGVLRSIHRRFMSGPPKNFKEDAMVLFRVAVLGRWLRRSSDAVAQVM